MLIYFNVHLGHIVCISKGQVDDGFAFEPVGWEQGGDVRGLDDVVERMNLRLQVAPLEDDEPIRHGVALGVADVLADEFHEVGQGHHGTADHEIELAFLLLGALLYARNIVQTNGLRDFVGDAYLLADAVDERELALGEQDGEGDAREAATRADIKDSGAAPEGEDLRDGERMEDVVLVEVVDVLARDDVDFGVPVAVEGVEGGELL